MNVSELLTSKGDKVVTVPADLAVTKLTGVLAEHGIGAAVVSDDTRTVQGIVSERDVVRALSSAGASVLDQPVSSIMTSDVIVCAPDTSVEQLAHQMTQSRIRHVPVVLDDQLHAVVSIGDVVKHRIAQLTDERDHLVGYLHQ